MALLWMEGFDQYPIGTLPGARWDTMVAPSVAAGVRSSKMLQLTSGLYADSVIADNAGTLIIGFAVNINTSTTGRYFASIHDLNGILHLTLMTNASGFEVQNSGGTMLVSVTASKLTWIYVELKITIHDTSGSVECRVNGSAAGSASGVDTRNNTGQSGASRLRLGWSGTATGYNFQFDDLYVIDTTGSVNTDFLGDCSVSILWPNGDSSVDMSRSGGATNAVNVAAIGDGDTSYVYTSTSGDQDMYDMTDTSSSALIYGIAVSGQVRAGDTGLRGYRLHLATGGNAWSADRIASSTYRHGIALISEATSGTTKWSASSISAAKIGVEAL